MYYSIHHAHPSRILIRHYLRPPPGNLATLFPKDSRCNPMMVLKGKEGEAAVSQPCNVLDLASFPPKAS